MSVFQQQRASASVAYTELTTVSMVPRCCGASRDTRGDHGLKRSAARRRRCLFLLCGCRSHQSASLMSALLFFLAALAVSATAAPLCLNEFDLARQLRSSKASCEQCTELKIDIAHIHGIHYCIKHGFCLDTTRPDAAATFVNAAATLVNVVCFLTEGLVPGSWAHTDRFGIVSPTIEVVALFAFALALSATRYLKKSGDSCQRAHEHHHKAVGTDVELYWLNNNTDWDVQSLKEFREIMIRMETATVRFYEDFGQNVQPSTHIAIQKFWAEEWGYKYMPETQQWLDLTTGRVIRSEMSKQVKFF